MWIMDFLSKSLKTLTRPLDVNIYFGPRWKFSLRTAKQQECEDKKKQQQQHSSAEPSLERREKEMKSKEEEEKKGW